jgi:Phosphoesterase family
LIDLASNKVIETLSTTLYPTLLAGSTPNSLALSEDEKTLYIANADNNCLAVFNVEKPGASYSKGFIPTGWYPTSVRTIRNKIYVANGKGFHSMANPNGPKPFINKTIEKGQGSMGLKPKEVQYIGGLFKGTLSIIPSPSEILQKTWTKWVYRNTPYTPEHEKEASGKINNPIPRKVGESTPITYVFYIIKENRTYDQVFGDIKEGNGDNSLCIFPEKITPNQHALVKNFVLLDNFYVDAEVSADGHNWSTAAYANDFVEKTWPTSYGGRGGNYDFEGTRKIAFPKDGFIWDHCNREGISYRTYGEFSEYAATSIESLKGHSCPKYPGFDLSIKDSDKERIWEKDFDSLLALEILPHFNSIRLGNDHTSGMRRGAYSILSSIADNDLAVGQFVEHLSNSSIWNQSAVFILEDDAQGGSDHVDAHRSTAYVISPYVKRNTVIHNPYTTSGMLRTMELILGLKPMSQYDAAATPMYSCFSQVANNTPYKAIPANIDINIKNTAWNEGARKSEMMDFTQEDKAPEQALNQIIWAYIKGANIPMPPPKHSAFILPISGSNGSKKEENE